MNIHEVVSITAAMAELRLRVANIGRLVKNLYVIIENQRKEIRRLRKQLGARE